MGQKIESNAKTILEALIGLRIQRTALEMTQGDKFHSEKESIIKRQDIISARALQARDITPKSEKDAIIYFEKFIEAGEPRAVHWLLKSQSKLKKRP